MPVNGTTSTRRIGRIIAATLAAGIGLALTGAPAFADQWGGWGHHDRAHYDHHGWQHHRWHRDNDWRRGRVYGYAPPPVYYAPPPPVYYAPPSVSFGVNIPFNR